jgi:hypothetical protein
MQGRCVEMKNCGVTWRGLYAGFGGVTTDTPPTLRLPSRAALRYAWRGDAAMLTAPWFLCVAGKGEASSWASMGQSMADAWPAPPRQHCLPALRDSPDRKRLFDPIPSTRRSTRMRGFCANVNVYAGLCEEGSSLRENSPGQNGRAK